MIAAVTVEAVLLAALGIGAVAVVGLVAVAYSAVRSLRTTPAAAPELPAEPKCSNPYVWEPPAVLAGEPPVPVEPIAPPPPPPPANADAVQFPAQLVNPLAAPIVDPADLAPKRLNRSTNPEGPDHEQ